MLSVLITGANGFVGRVLCEKMVTDGWQVRGTVRSAKQVASVPIGVQAVKIESIAADTDWSDALAGVDAVVHLAARVHVMNDTASDPLSAFRQINVAGTERLARMAATHGVKRFVYISSVKVNGERCEKPFTEHNIPAPQDPYGVSKWEAEQVLHKVDKDIGLEVVILRPPLVYGPGVKANFLSLLKLVDRAIPLPLSSITNLRSFIYVGNLVDAIITCISHPKAAGQTYLVSDGEDVSTPELIRRVAVALGRPGRLFPFPPSLMRFAGKLFGKSDAVERLVSSLTIDSSKIQRELEWKPPYTMEQGLRETTVWYRKSMNVETLIM
ncbi:MAG: NAD-dependent dehydratase [Planctomycetes bacterium RBG_16_43_13]|nr:MAG: NAD-dependent dehydratase [Planctomycetes bacterium RBG_16_43_13]